MHLQKVPSGAQLQAHPRIKTHLGWFLQVAKVLLSKGASTEVIDRWGTSPLFEALSINALTVAEMLIARGSRLRSNNFELVKDASEVDSGRLVLACMKANASPDSCDYDKRSVLHAQCLAGNLKAINALLAVGADVNVQDRFARSWVYLHRARPTFPSPPLRTSAIVEAIHFVPG